MSTMDQTDIQTQPERHAGNGRGQDRTSQSQSSQDHSAQGHDGARRRQQRPRINVSENERAVSLAAGTILALLGLSRRSVPGLVIAGVGGALAYRGATGHCPAYEAGGIDTARGGDGRQPDEIASDISERGIHVEQAFLINRSPKDLYTFWRNFENLPRIMTHLESVTTTGDRRSHWVAKAQVAGGKRFEWDAEITHDEPDSLIGWQSLPGAGIDNSGQIRFSPALGDRGTEVHVFIDYVPPAGRLGHWVASMLGQNPRRVVREDLRNFKRIMEIGEIPTIIGQPHGTCKGQGERYTESEWKPLFT